MEAEFLKLATDKPNELILFVIKGRYPFITNLANLDLSDCISVLLLNSANADKFSKDQLNRFDFVHHFNEGEFWTAKDMSTHFDALEFPQLEAYIDRLIALLINHAIDIKRVRMVAMEEAFVRAVAKIRQHHNIVGPKSDDVRRFTDKECMKQVADQGNLPSAKYDIVSPSDLKENTKKLEYLETSLGYPIMFKPKHGAGSSGIVKIENHLQLKKWINDHSQPDMSYVAEEYIDGREYSALALVQRPSIQLFPAYRVVNGVSIWTSIHHNVPLCMGSEHDPEKRAIVEEFARNTVKVFDPPDGGLAFVQGFLTKDGRMLFGEIAYRVPGLIGSAIFMENTGISPETVQIMAQIRPLNLNRLFELGQKRKQYFAKVAYPKKEGVVKNIVELEKTNLKSEAEVVFAIKPGEKTKAATSIGQMAVRIYLWNDNKDQLKDDCDWLRDNYCPVIMEK